MSNKILLDKLNNEKSLYAVSHATGIPYTTISKLSRGLLDINKCSGDVIYRLSLYFRCSMEDLLNPVQMMTGISGTYREKILQNKNKEMIITTLDIKTDTKVADI